MAYDSKTYGQSPFGGPKQPDAPKAEDAGQSDTQGQPPEKPPEKPPKKQPEKPQPPANDGLSQGFKDIPKEVASQVASQVASRSKASLSGLVSKFPTLSGSKLGSQNTIALSPDSSSGLPETHKSRSNSRSTAKTSSRKSKKGKASKTAKAEVDAAEEAVAQRFFEEDRSAYLSLLYKTVISGLVWAVARLSWTVLRLSDNGLSQEAIALIKIAIHPVVIAAVALACTIALTFWARRLLKDLARHTQQIHLDAEAPDGKSFRPTLEIVGDSLDYNPRLRKNIALLFDTASILICSLVSYLIAFVLFPISS